ncbi:MAG: hypothetical protein Q4A32_10315 [Lachnospiraceae bacterium]|nr:hypothetical protein [Lachnospiraceae bacterium]
MDTSNFVENRIERYIRDVVSQLPRSERKDAREKLECAIYSMLREYAGDREPDLQDVREVLRELGTPDQAVAAYYELRDMRQEYEYEFGSDKTWRLLPAKGTVHRTLKVLMICAICMLLFGLLGLALHVVSDVRLIFAGCALALVVQTVQIIVPGGTSSLGDGPFGTKFFGPKGPSPRDEYYKEGEIYSWKTGKI